MKFTVKTKSGATIQVEAVSESEAIANLSNKGIRVMSIKGDAANEAVVKKVSAEEVAKFCAALETFQRVHAPMILALEQIAAASEANLRAAVLEVLKGMKAGKTFDEAVKDSGAFPSILQPIFKASFQSGKFIESLRLLTKIYEEKQKFTSGLIFMLIQPALVLSTIVGFALFVLYFQVPNDRLMVKEIGTTPPSALRMAIFMGDSLVIVGPIILVAIAFAYWRVSRTKGELMARLYPVLESKWNIGVGSVIRCVDLTMFISILSMMAGSGLQQTDILRNLAAVFEGKPFGNELARAAADSERHGDLVKALKDHVKRLPGDIMFAIQLGMTTANLYEVTGTLADSYFGKCKKEMDKAGQQVTAIAMLLCAMGIIFMIALTMAIKMQILSKMSLSGGGSI